MLQGAERKREVLDEEQERADQRRQAQDEEQQHRVMEVPSERAHGKQQDDQDADKQDACRAKRDGQS